MIETTVRPVDPLDADDVEFCVRAAGYAGLTWDANTVLAYANDPMFLLTICMDGKVRAGMLQTRKSERRGGRSRAQCLAIDIVRYPEGSKARVQIADALIHAAVIDGVASLSDVKVPIGSPVIEYLDTLPASSRTETKDHVEYVFVLTDMKAEYEKPERKERY